MELTFIFTELKKCIDSFQGCVTASERPEIVAKKNTALSEILGPILRKYVKSTRLTSEPKWLRCLSLNIQKPFEAQLMSLLDLHVISSFFQFLHVLFFSSFFDCHSYLGLH